MSEVVTLREATRLTTLQSGSKVFLDSNIFTYHLSGHSVFGEPCREFLKNIERGIYEGYVNDVVFSEVLLNYIKSELFRQRGIKPHKVVQEIKRDPSQLDLVNFDVVTNLLEHLGVETLPISCDCNELVKIIQEHLLLPHDALHVVTMHRYGIPHIATNDPDFERVDWLTVWKP
ncbi:MAG: type II toxin-antitoxin system VapC family toxin [Candidatus Methanospirareceae archaeon]